MTLLPDKLSGMSLGEKLPLAGSALIAIALLIAGTLAYLEVRQAARSEAEDRLSSLSSELVSVFQAGMEERAELKEDVETSRAVRGALLTGRVDTADLILALDTLRRPADGSLPVALMGPDREPVFSIGVMPESPDPDPEPSLTATPSFGPIRGVGGRNLYWESTPILGSQDQVLGWIVQRRRLQSSADLGRFWGRGIRFRLGQLGDSIWVDLAGERWTMDPDGVQFRDPFTFETGDGTAMLAQARRIDRTPWVVLVDMPLSQVVARQRAFLVQLLLLGSVVIVGSVLLMWWVSRRLTGPLVELAEAADAMSSGEYGRRVETEGGDELGRLAGAFNRMSARVARSEAALHERLEEARRLAASLAQARQAAEDARSEAEAANSAKADILAAISHEIRTPISAVMAYAEMLTQTDGVGDPERRLRYIRRIEECTEMLTVLTDDILDFACIESGRLRIDIAPAQVDDVVGFVVGSLKPKALRKEITISPRCDQAAVFLGDRQRVQQIVMNLVSNAVKFTPEGGTVTLRCQSGLTQAPTEIEEGSGPWVAIHVEDTGPGIEPEELDRIFEPFERGGANGDGGGSHVPGVGLGLSISKRLARMMSGTLTVESRPGEGARFTLWLPAGVLDRPARTKPRTASTRSRHIPPPAIPPAER